MCTCYIAQIHFYQRLLEKPCKNCSAENINVQMKTKLSTLHLGNIFNMFDQSSRFLTHEP